MLATIASAALQGIDAEPVHVEVNAGEAGEPRLFNVMTFLFFSHFSGFRRSVSASPRSESLPQSI
jgi:hypothetical protein